MTFDFSPNKKLDDFFAKELQAKPAVLEGTLTRSVGLSLEGRGFKAPIGTLCNIVSNSNLSFKAVVTGFKEDIFYLMPLQDTTGIEIGSRIFSSGSPIQIPVGKSLLGRVIDSLGNPLDDAGDVSFAETRDLTTSPVNPLSRSSITKTLDVGVRAINSLFTIGIGQRIGLFAGSGVGKSMLLGMITKYTKADVVVVCLTGERGREVNDFIKNNIDSNDMQRTIVVASPADYAPILRLNAAFAAMTIAEYFRDNGSNVLLLMDSLTRFSLAQREIALSMGEPPVARGYPPSVFALLPRLIERAGIDNNTKGAITGIFTVLVEGDDENDPIVDAARAILDGHIVLSRKLADVGHFPAISLEKSISRVMHDIVSPEQKIASRELKKILSIYNENKDLINIGAYAKGNNKDLDWAVDNINNINTFLSQDYKESSDFTNSVNSLQKLLGSKV